MLHSEKNQAKDERSRVVGVKTLDKVLDDRGGVAISALVDFGVHQTHPEGAGATVGSDLWWGASDRQLR